MDVVTEVLHILVDNALADHLKAGVHEMLTPGYTEPQISEEQKAAARALLAQDEQRQAYLASQAAAPVAEPEAAEPVGPHPSQLPEPEEASADAAV